MPKITPKPRRRERLDRPSMSVKEYDDLFALIAKVVMSEADGDWIEDEALHRGKQAYLNQFVNKFKQGD